MPNFFEGVNKAEAMERVLMGWLFFRGEQRFDLDRWKALNFGPDCTAKVLVDATKEALAIPDNDRAIAQAARAYWMEYETSGLKVRRCKEDLYEQLQADVSYDQLHERVTQK